MPQSDQITIKPSTRADLPLPLAQAHANIQEQGQKLFVMCRGDSILVKANENLPLSFLFMVFVKVLSQGDLKERIQVKSQCFRIPFNKLMCFLKADS